ncbi:MAG: RidA family protein, partial [Alphaproteobacteria bacterium]
MAGKIEARLVELKLELPEAPAPIANYVPSVVAGKLIFVSGQITRWKGENKFVGKLGRDLSIEEGQQAARLCALNLIAQVRTACGGDLDRLRRVVRLGGFVNCTPDFGKQPQVLNGASDLMVEVFGDTGRHA